MGSLHETRQAWAQGGDGWIARVAAGIVLVFSRLAST